MKDLNNITKYQKDIDRLISDGDGLMMGLLNELKDELEDYKQLSKEQQECYSHYTFKEKYNEWYNESLSVIKQLMPERFEDFVGYYKVLKRKELSYDTYTISDYLIEVTIEEDWKVVNRIPSRSVFLKYQQQLNIVKSLQARFNSSLYEIKQLLQADIFDSELDSASELCKKGFYRAAGAVCGVVIEKHLQQVVISHNLSMSKKHPVINDYNDLLKNNNIIDIETFRRIQWMGDIRNKCDHNKDTEPTKENIEELIELTNKLIKNVY